MDQPSPAADDAGRPTRRAMLSGLAGTAALAAVALSGCRGRANRPAELAPAAGPGGNGTTPDAQASTGDGSRPATGPGGRLVDDDAVHLALRLTYGLAPGLIEEIRRAGTDAWLNAQLSPSALSEPAAVTDRLAALPSLSLSPTELAQRYPDGERNVVAFEAIVATIVRQAYSPAQLREVMVEFWTNHFAINVFAGPQRLLKPVDDREVVRPHALGRFADLLAASARSPAMLVFLNNAVSRAGAINENYGRELLELHTLGVDAGYGEAHVVGAAKTLTGWTTAARRGEFRFVAAWHDPAPQEVLDWRTPARLTGEAVGADLLDHLAHHPATAKHLAAKLVTRFVGEGPYPDLVDHLATVYQQSGTDIAAVLRALFARAEFRSAPPKFRRPHELFVAMVRATGASIDVGAAPAARSTAGNAAAGTSPAARAARGPREGTRRLLETLRNLGQLPMAWPAPNGYPDMGPAWLGPGSLLARWNLAADLAGDALGGVSCDVRPLVGTVGSLDDAVVTLAGALLGGPLDGASAQVIVDAAAAVAGNGATSPPTSATTAPSAPVRSATGPSDAQLRTAAALLLCSPRFQYR